MTTADNQPLGQALAENQAFLQTMFGGSSDFYTKSFTICGCRCCIAMFAGGTTGLFALMIRNAGSGWLEDHPPVETYTAHGTLMVKSTGLALEDADGKPVTATAEFTPDKPSGTVDVTFEFDASKIEEGVELVAFEECLDVNGNVIAVHQDIEDDGQTVVVDNPDTPKVPDEPGKGYDKTGFDTTMLFAAVVILIAAGAACGIYAIRKRKQASIESDEDAGSETDES